MRLSKTIFYKAMAVAIGAAVPPCQAALAESVESQVPALLPLPRESAFAAGNLPLTGPLRATIRGCERTLVAKAVDRANRDIGLLTGAPLAGPALTMTIRCRRPGAATEDYRLVSTRTGLSIEAGSSLGAMRALATLRQLVRTGSEPAIAFARIGDAPRFAWRGVMIDTARHFMPVAALKRQIAAMERVKLNVLHLHLSDNEGFRVESRLHPKLTTVGSHGEYYTQAEVRDLVAYAAERGVRIVPEFDVPGHTLALLKAYPELAPTGFDPAAPGASLRAALSPAKPETYAFLESLFGEMAALFPDRYFHVGGDEVPGLAWQGDPQIEDFKRTKGLATKAEVEGYFHARLRAILARHGKLTIGWDEIAASPLPKGTVVQAWRTSNQTSLATAKGYRTVVSAGYYLDYLHSVRHFYGIDPFDPNAYSSLSREDYDRLKNAPGVGGLISEMSVGRPMPPLTPAQQRLILGAEAPLWSEGVSADMLDIRLWPRAAALAERYWSPAEVRDPIELLRRLAPVQERLRFLGLADEAMRMRMLEQLAPGQSGSLSILLEATAPDPVFAQRRIAQSMMQGSKAPPRPLLELAAAASTDSIAAQHLAVDILDVLAGRMQAEPRLRATLERWRDNGDGLARATGNPQFEAAIPLARDIAELSCIALAALDGRAGKGQLSTEKQARATTLLARFEALEATPKAGPDGRPAAAPPANLIVPVWRDLRLLLDAAKPR